MTPAVGPKDGPMNTSILTAVRTRVGRIRRAARRIIVRSRQAARRLDPATSQRYKDHVISRALETPLGEYPFFHLSIAEILPPDLFEGLRKLMSQEKNSGARQDRGQDSPLYVTRRSPLYDSMDRHALHLRRIFNDPEVIRAFLSRFYVNPTDELVQSLSILDREFEFTYCEPDRFQNIHCDLPTKYLSCVIYFADGELTPEEQRRNGTVLYNADVEPVYSAEFEANRAVCFASHFRSYHGFSTTIHRDALVIFIVDRSLNDAWFRARPWAEKSPFPFWAERMEHKLRSAPMLEFSNDPDAISAARASTRVNAPEGRVLVDDDGRPVPPRQVH